MWRSMEPAASFRLITKLLYDCCHCNSEENMAASTLISNIPSDRSNLKKTDGKQKIKDVATVQVEVASFLIL